MSSFLIYKASAGSGKTFALVRNFLSLALDAKDKELPTRFSKILAITFTNKAANEMKERVMSNIREIVCEGGKSAMAQAVAQDIHVDITELQRRAQIVHKAILHNYSNLSICTIDSFMHRVVRTFARDLHLPANFNVELQTEELVKQSVDELFSQIGEDNDPDLTKLLHSYMTLQMHNKGKSNIESDILDFAKNVFNEETPAFLKKLEHLGCDDFLKIQEQMQADNDAFKAKVQASAGKLMQLFYDNQIVVSDLYHGKSGVYPFVEKLSKGELEALEKINSYVLTSLNTGTLYSSQVPKSKQAIIDTVSSDILSSLQELVNFQKDYALYNTRKMLLQHLLSVAVMNRLNAIIKSYSHDNELVHISEFNKVIYNVVEKEPVPFVFERLGNRYTNFLIDEFQDTSYMQWHNLVPLLENGVSSGERSLVVGDAKQAIYRFRQGDVNQFIKLPEVENSIHGATLAQPHVSEVAHLDTNFRSCERIVNFNNTFFDWVVKTHFPDHPLIPAVYSQQSQKWRRPGGYVNVCYKDKESIPETVYDTIKQLVEDRGYSFSDIAIIARENKFLDSITACLTQRTINGVPVPIISSETFKLENSRVVRLLYDVLKALLSPNDRASVAFVVEDLRLLHRLDSDCLMKLQAIEYVALDEVLFSLGDYRLPITEMVTMPLYDCVSYLLRLFKLEGVDAAYVATFLNYINRYAKNHRQDLSEFLETFDRDYSKLSTTTASDLNAVRMLTIHKAKGLEAPIIIYPVFLEEEKKYVTWVEVPQEIPGLNAGIVTISKDSISIYSENRASEILNRQMDDLNLFYVALTRPREKMFLIFDNKEKKFGPRMKEFIAQDIMSVAGDYKFGDEGNESYSLGENTSKDTSGKTPSKKAETIELDNISFPQWETRIDIADQTHDIFSEATKSRIEWGNCVHAILSQIHDVNEMEAALTQYQEKHNLEPEKAQKLRTMLTHFLHRDDIAPFFAPGVKVLTECSLVFENQELRPDRIVFEEGCTHIIDFKTGKPKLQDEEQILRYARAIESMGYPQVQTHLLYLEEE